MSTGALLELDKLGRTQANATIAGEYKGAQNSRLTIGPATSAPGLAITSLSVNGSDWLSRIAQKSGIDVSNLDFRLYPTGLEDRYKRAFRAVIQDMDALVDAGTPTCISWQTVDGLQKNGLPLDEFVFELEGGVDAAAVEIPALGIVLDRLR